MTSYASETILTPAQVAEWLQVSTKTLAHLPIPSKRLGHRTRRYLARDVLEYLSAFQTRKAS